MNLNSKIVREIGNLSQLRHPHIMKLYEVISVGDEIHLITEYLKCGTLHSLISTRALSLPHVRKLFQQIVSAIQYCHRKLIVHRDLKLENILMSDESNCKVADFGLSNFISDGDFLETFCGSLNYTAPEIISKTKYSGPSVDVWSCGVILYTLITRKLPFSSPNPRTLFQQIKSGVFEEPQILKDNPGALDLIHRMIVVNPQKRINLCELQYHSWFSMDIPQYLLPPFGNMNSMDDSEKINLELVKKVAQIMDIDEKVLLGSLERGIVTHGTVAYKLLNDNLGLQFGPEKQPICNHDFDGLSFSTFISNTSIYGNDDGTEENDYYNTISNLRHSNELSNRNIVTGVRNGNCYINNGNNNASNTTGINIRTNNNEFYNRNSTGFKSYRVFRDKNGELIGREYRDYIHKTSSVGLLSNNPKCVIGNSVPKRDNNISCKEDINLSQPAKIESRSKSDNRSEINSLYNDNSSNNIDNNNNNNCVEQNLDKMNEIVNYNSNRDKTDAESHLSFVKTNSGTCSIASNESLFQLSTTSSTKCLNMMMEPISEIFIDDQIILPDDIWHDNNIGLRIQLDGDVTPAKILELMIESFLELGFEYKLGITKPNATQSKDSKTHNDGLKFAFVAKYQYVCSRIASNNNQEQCDNGNNNNMSNINGNNTSNNIIINSNNYGNNVNTNCSSTGNNNNNSNNNNIGTELSNTTSNTKEDKYKHKCHKIRGLRPMTIGVRMYKLSTVSQYDISMKFLGEKNNDNGNNLHLNKNACNENIKTSENEENPARFYTIDVRLFDGDAISFLGVVDMIETSVCRKMREQM